MQRFFLLPLCSWLLPACASLATSPTLAPVAVLTPASTQLPASTLPPEQDPRFRSSGGGEPRSPAYWLLWHSCAADNQAETARDDGGREAGWIILDDLLADPGILVGDLQIETCQQGVRLLQAQDLQGNDHQNDPAYTLTAQLLAAQLNQATGSEYCPASDQADSAAQLLLLEVEFVGTQAYLGPPAATPDRDTALFLADKLAKYNSATLCLP